MEAPMRGLITYNIVGDEEDKLKQAARTACNFWNHFVSAKASIVIRLGVFYEDSATIARAYKPFEYSGVMYGVVQFNTKYLGGYTQYEIAGTVIHEIGHTLGFGWDAWMDLFYADSGKFKSEYVGEIPALADMLVETDYGSGTKYAHWDEESFGKELMTGFQDNAEHVLPVTISVMRLLGHDVNEELEEQTDLELLMKMYETVAFSRKDEAERIERDYFTETDLWEEVFTAKT